MIIICITTCVTVALICATVCYTYHEKTYSTNDLSEAQLIKDIYCLVINQISANQDAINDADESDEDTINMIAAAKNLLFVLDTIVTMTKSYKDFNN